MIHTHAKRQLYMILIEVKYNVIIRILMMERLHSVLSSQPQVGLASSFGQNRVGIFTWRKQYTQLPKRSGLVLEQWRVD
jgi:hypothetical protein